MKPTKLIPFILSVVFLASCEKVIEVELNDADPKIVIEGLLEEGTSDFYVSVTKTTDYFDNKPIEAIDGAVVVLSDDMGNSTSLTALGSGLYLAPVYTAVEGRNYRLVVSVEGATYSAEAYLPPTVMIDTLRSEPQIFGNFTEEGEALAVYCILNDPKDVRNYYRIFAKQNSLEFNEPFDFLLFDDKFSDGQRMDLPIYSRSYIAGDSVFVELRSVDEFVYDYYLTLASIIGAGGGPESASPANPNTNIVGGAIGYFGAMSKDQIMVVLPE